MEKPSRPLWLIISLLVITLVPLSFTPALFAALPAAPGALSALTKLFPLANVAYSVCAYLCWPERKTLSLILTAMSILTSAALIIPLFF